MKHSLVNRALATIAGVMIISLGIAWMRFSSFGTDPFVTMNIGIAQFLALPFGTVQMVMNLLFLLFMLRFSKRSIHLGTALGIFLVGYLSDFVLSLLTLLPLNIYIRVLAMCIGLLCCTLGVAIYMRADLGISPYDAAAKIIEEQSKTKLKYREIRVLTDLGCVCVGFLLGAPIGMGTVLTAFFTGPLINFFGEKIEQITSAKKSVPVTEINK
ncbi:YczE/YyaS/YitT family protein [Enterococcus sp. AZ163]|uniref:YczE/YyaS/YitT family protein n=1 Tax=Enterococcus sp. AZ163 TaxID=2774638 RepID=UPI003D2D52C7